MSLKIATSQFAISANIVQNKAHIIAQIQEAKEKACDIIHFPECSLSGYAGVDFPSFAGFDWDFLDKQLQEILSFVKTQDIWVILGSSHLSKASSKLFNSLYVINNKGRIVDRYDKLFCAGDDRLNLGDLAHYTSGNHFTTFSIKGVKCGLFICHDYRYPELYRVLKKKDVALVFHSYHAGNMDTTHQAFMEEQVGEENTAFNQGKTYPEITMPATMVSYAANNYFWISCSNTSAKESCWASFMVRPDGVKVGQLTKNKQGILITEIDTKKAYYDSTELWRERSMDGIYFSGGDIESYKCLNCSEIVVTNYCGHCGQKVGRSQFSLKDIFSRKG